MRDLLFRQHRGNESRQRASGRKDNAESRTTFLRKKAVCGCGNGFRLLACIHSGEEEKLARCVRFGRFRVDWFHFAESFLPRPDPRRVELSGIGARILQDDRALLRSSYGGAQQMPERPMRGMKSSDEEIAEDRVFALRSHKCRAIGVSEGRQI